MNEKDVAHLRLHNLHLSGTFFDAPEHVVEHLVAVQSQDYGPAKWSIAQRARGVRDAQVDEAFARGAILRTHVLRPTWHFVLPSDIRWLLDLTGPRVRRQMSYYDRRLGIDDEVSRKSTRLIVKALKREGMMTRTELADALEKGGLEARGQPLNHLVMNAELSAAICSGGLRGKQHTYALLEERAPDARRLSREDALAELTLRYFGGHGPATVKDMRWWSGLTMNEIKSGLEMVRPELSSETVAGATYWFADGPLPRRPRAPAAHFLQAYDEYVVGYAESRLLMDHAKLASTVLPTLAEGWSGVVIVGDQVSGHYKRTLTKSTLGLDVTLYRALKAPESKAIRVAADRWGAFLGIGVELQIKRLSKP